MSPADLTPEEIQACLKVLNTIHAYDEEHPDYVAIRRATGKMFKAVKRHRRVTKRDEIAEADRAVIALTATAARTGSTTKPAATSWQPRRRAKSPATSSGPGPATSASSTTRR
ncbi:short chain dehydrogenase [Arthrobacter sp. Hiyo8]|nr:short chain dehydrogenase [Arthrobacter sp. Hiyo8]